MLSAIDCLTTTGLLRAIHMTNDQRATRSDRDP